MEDLKELIKIVSKVKVQQIEIIGQDASNNSAKSQALYDGIANGLFDTDEAAALAIYGSAYKKGTYTKLKKHLESKLLNTLLFINLNKETHSKVELSYIHANKLLVVIKMLAISIHGLKKSIKLCNQLLKIGLKFGFTDQIIYTSNRLKSYAYTYLKDDKKVAYYDKILKKYYKIKGYEILAQDAVYYLNRHLSVNKVASKEAINELNKKSKQLQKIIKKYSSFELLPRCTMVILSTYQLNKQYEKQLQEGFTLLGFLEKNPNYKRPFLLKTIFSCNLEAAIILKRFQIGKRMINLYFQSFKNESFNSYLIIELYLILCLHTKKWNETYQFYYTFVNQKFLKQLNIQKEERLNIIQAYLYFLSLTNKIAADLQKKQFRLNKFLNEVPHYSQDKRGINIPILIVQILILLAQKKRNTIIDKQDALQQYSWRYLRNDQTLRSNCFIKMLGCMTKANFHKNATIRATKKYHQKLIANPARNYLNAHFIEIIPFEDQWEMVLELLENKAR